MTAVANPQPLVGADAKNGTKSSEEQNSVELVTDFVGELSGVLDAAVESIGEVNSNTHLLALNARIEAARAGAAGAAFGIVAQEMQSLSSRTDEIAREMAKTTRASIDNLLGVVDSNVRGGRLASMALTNVDLIDRNLYERTCDVRWWATDSSVVDALTDQTDATREHASHRLGVILDAYTVYHDLVLCDLSGRIIANGRPQQFASQGADVSNSAWFRSAAATRSGDEYGFETAHHSDLVSGRSVLVYSCGVRAGGQADGKLLGVLGILFNWEDFAQTIMAQTPLSVSERSGTRCCICDDAGKILADSQGQQLSGSLPTELVNEVFHSDKSHVMTKAAGKPACVGYARAPGFETYTTGWHSVIVQEM